MHIYLGGHLNFYHPQKERWLAVELAQPTRLQDVLAVAGIPFGEVHLVVINGENIDLEAAIISEQDEVKVFSPVGGG